MCLGSFSNVTHSLFWYLHCVWPHNSCALNINWLFCSTLHNINYIECDWERMHHKNKKRGRWEISSKAQTLKPTTWIYRLESGNVNTDDSKHISAYRFSLCINTIWKLNHRLSWKGCWLFVECTTVLHLENCVNPWCSALSDSNISWHRTSHNRRSGPEKLSKANSIM